MEVYNWMLIAEEHALGRARGSDICRDYRGCRIVPKILTKFECYPDVCYSEPLEYDTVLVAAFYPIDRIFEDFLVHVGDSVMIQLVIPKVRGANWVPLVTRTQHVFIPSRNSVRIYPKPVSVIALEIQPK